MRREIIPPVINPETATFWAAAAKGELLIGHCAACNEPHYYPRRHCPFCLAPNVALIAAKGRGRVHAFTVMRKTATPYACGYVTLDEGPMMLCDIVTEDFEGLAIDMAVELVFLPFEGGQLPAFAPSVG